MGKRKTHDEFVSELSVKHPNIVALSIYDGYRVKVKFKCLTDGHEWESRPESVMTNIYGCPKCAKSQKKNKRTKSHEEFVSEIKLNFPNIEVLSEYKKGTIPVSFRCLIDGHEWNTQPRKMKVYKYGCPKCGGSLKKTTKEFIKEVANINNNIIVVGEYKSYNTKIEFECSIDGHKWKALPGSITTSMSGCPECARKTKESNGAKEIGEVLKRNGYLFEKEKRFNECKNKIPLAFDYYINTGDKIILIEYQGRQHYKSIDYWGGQEAFNIRKINDEIKRAFCIKNKIQLIEVPYWIKTEEIEEFLIGLLQ